MQILKTITSTLIVMKTCSFSTSKSILEFYLLTYSECIIILTSIVEHCTVIVTATENSYLLFANSKDQKISRNF